MSLIQAKELISNLHELGGKATIGLFAEKIEMSEGSGSFRAKLSSLSKYNLVKYGETDIELTSLGIQILNAYSGEEEKLLLFKSLMSIPTFAEIVNRFYNTKLDFEILDRILIREYGVNNRHVQTLKKTFIESSRFIDLLDDDGIFNKDFQANKIEIASKEDLTSKKIDKAPQKEQSAKIVHYSKNSDELLDVVNISEEIFDLIIYLGGILDFKKKSFDEIIFIVEKYSFLTHTKLAFEILKNNLSTKELLSENVKIILKAIKQDLKILK
jgi:hypothetical protein